MTKARDLANLISGGFTEADIPNLSASKITSGTFADARLSASSVQQFASTFDDNKIVNDISTLGLRVHTQENLNVSNTNSASFDVFNDSNGVTNLTNCFRDSQEFMATTGEQEHTNDSDTQSLVHFNNNVTDENSNVTWTNNNVTFNSSIKKLGTHSGSFNGSNTYLTDDSGNSQFYTSGDWTIESWFYLTSAASGAANQIFEWSNGSTSKQSVLFGYLDESNMSYQIYGGYSGGWSLLGSNLNTGNNTISLNTWQHLALTKQGSTTRLYLDGVQRGSVTTSWNVYNDTNIVSIGGINHGYFNGYIDEFRFSHVNRYPDGTTFTPNLVSNATGSFEGVAITAGASTSKMGAVITYQDNAGTNALNTDIILKLSADNGSNYSTATLTALPDFATGIKMCKVNDLSVTAGTQLKYKIEFANQASGSKEARIRGVSLQY